MNNRILISVTGIMAVLMLGVYCSDTPRDVVMSSDGVKISFDDQGAGEPSIVFVHGWSNDKSIWDAQMSQFSNIYRVVAIDLPGFGESGDSRKDWTIEAYGRDVGEVIRALNLKQVVLVGFSMGGSVMIEAAGNLPERVIGVVLVDDLQNVETKFPPPVENYLDSVFMDLVTNPTKEKLLAGGFIKKNPDSAFVRILSMLEGPSRIGWQESFHGYIQWINEDCTESLKELQVPVFAINSTLEPTNVEAFRKYVPSFEAHILPDAGHVLMWDATDEFNRLLVESIQKMVDIRRQI